MIKRSQAPDSFFWNLTSVISSLQNVDNQLTYKEQTFLVNCLMFIYEGNELEDFFRLTKYQIAKGFTRDSGDVSVYKNKLGTKKWAITGRNVFTLPDNFMECVEGLKNNKNFEFVLKLTTR